jgi:hypothetical protein
MGRGKTTRRALVAIFVTVLLIDVLTLVRGASANVLWGYWEVGPQISRPTPTPTATPGCIIGIPGGCPNCNTSGNCQDACNATCPNPPGAICSGSNNDQCGCGFCSPL